MDSTANPPDRTAAPTLAGAAAVIDSLARSMLRQERYEHSLRVAETAASLFARYGLDPERGRLAGLAHDLCKNLPKAERRRLAADYFGPGGIDAAPDEDEEDRIDHGPAAAAFLAREGIVADPEILDAIAFHTVGKPGMSRLALALYAADKLEPGRSSWRADTRRDVALGLYDGEGGLERLVADLAAATVEHVRSQGWRVAPATLILYNALTGKSL